ncbi:TPA: hypothetical protein ACNGYJ_005887, partial [Klebsiella quasipneumoniae subsp. quasipneumoniae]
VSLMMLSLSMEVDMFGFGIHAALTKEMFKTAPRRDQDLMMQALYDQGYSAKDISNFLGIGLQSVYNRINAHRGRSGVPA